MASRRSRRTEGKEEEEDGDLKKKIPLEDIERRFDAFEKELDNLEEAEGEDRATKKLSKFKPEDQEVDALLEEVSKMKFSDMFEEVFDDKEDTLDEGYSDIMAKIEKVKKSYKTTLEVFDKCDAHVREISKNFADIESLQLDKKAQAELDTLLANVRKDVGGTFKKGHKPEDFDLDDLAPVPTTPDKKKSPRRQQHRSSTPSRGARNNTKEASPQRT